MSLSHGAVGFPVSFHPPPLSFMIKQLNISNFQSHPETQLTFSPGVNVIVGTSDSGKSAILRSLLWVLTNRPLGNSFIRKGTNKVKVQVETDTGTVVRVKGGKDNCYQIGDDILTAMGSDVPAQVTDLLGLEDVNLQRQFDGFFLLMDSPGKIATAVNAVTQLEDAENVSRKLGNEISRDDSEIKKINASLESLETLVSRFSFLDDAVPLLDRIKTLNADVDQQQAAIGSLTALVASLRRLDSEVVQPVPREAETFLDDSERLLGICSSLTAEVATIQSIVKALKLLEVKLAAFPPVDSAPLDRATDLASDVSALSGQVSDLCLLEEDFLATESYLDITDKDLIYLKKEEQRILAQLTNCPTCGQLLDADTRKVVLGEAT